MADGDGQSSGPSTDRYNEPVIDPTQNVLDLVRAGNRRQDDLRKVEARHIREILALRAESARELREAESGRIDAIREVDTKSVQQAAVDAEVRASALAAQVSAAAEANRAQVAAAATATATALAQALAPITSRLEQLSQAMYETQGQKTQIVETQARGMSVGAWIGIAFGAATFLLAIIGTIVAVAAILLRG